MARLLSFEGSAATIRRPVIGWQKFTQIALKQIISHDLQFTAACLPWRSFLSWEFRADAVNGKHKSTDYKMF